MTLQFHSGKPGTRLTAQFSPFRQGTQSRSALAPLLVPERSTVQLVPTCSPVGEDLVHKCHELLAVPAFAQVRQFVDDDVLEASPVLLRQLGIQPDRP